jgi:hypothetical protein
MTVLTGRLEDAFPLTQSNILCNELWLVEFDMQFIMRFIRVIQPIVAQPWVPPRVAVWYGKAEPGTNRLSTESGVERHFNQR